VGVLSINTVFISLCYTATIWTGQPGCQVSCSVAGCSRTKLFIFYSFGPLQPVTESVDRRPHLQDNFVHQWPAEIH